MEKKNYNKRAKGKRKVFTPEHISNLKKSFSIAFIKSQNKAGELSRFWKGGVTKQNILIRSSVSYKQWRRKIMVRDNFTCRDCSKVGGKLEVDHIKPFAFFPELRFAESNGKTLCHDCHVKTNFNRGYWQKYFQEKLQPTLPMAVNA